MTNRERLNVMSDSELANWLCNVGYKCYDTVYVDDIDDLCYSDGYRTVCGGAVDKRRR